MKARKVLSWYPNIKKYPFLSQPVRFPRKMKKFFNIFRNGDYFDISEGEAQQIMGSSYHAGRYRLTILEDKYDISIR
jgi:hypothetical protein